MQRIARLVLPALAVAALSASACAPCNCPNVGAGGGRVTATGGTAGTSGLRAYAAADVQTALAQCDLPHGPVVSPATYGDKRAFMVGAWIDCAPSVATVFSPAIVFLADGTWQRLSSDGNGGLVPGDGSEDRGTYAFPSPDTEPALGADVNVDTAGGGTLPTEYSSGPLTLESSPDRIHVIITYLDQRLRVWLVRLPIP